MTTGFVLIGPFQSLPPYVKQASNQPNFDKWHAVLLLNGKPNSFVDEYTGEVDYYWLNGIKHLTFTDCVPATVCDAVSAVLGIPLDYRDREALQSAMGTKPTQTDPFAGANLPEAQAGANKMWPGRLKTTLSNAWATIRQGSDDGTGYCWIFEPMAKSKAPQRVKIADMLPFVAANNNQYLKIEAVPLPDTSSTEADMDPTQDIPAAVCTVGQTWFFSDPSLAGSTQIQAVSGLAKVGLYWQNSRATALRVAFGSHNTDLRVVYVPNASVSNIRVSDAAPDCTAAVKAATDPLNAKIATLTGEISTDKATISTLQGRIAKAKADLG